jgi:hypothetical protein
LSPGRSAHRSLFEYAGELRQKAAEQIERAALIEQAALECQSQMAAKYGAAA